MATAKKLPSGSWRCQVYSHTEEIPQPDGTTKKKRIYKSFTSDIPGPKGKRDAEKQAADWAANKEVHVHTYEAMTFARALDGYISAKTNVLSPTTLREYKSSQKTAYEDIACIPLCELDSITIQRWINRYSSNHAPKTVRNAYGLLTAAATFYYPAFRYLIKVNLPQRKKPELYTPSDTDIKKLLSSIHGTNLEIAVYLGAFCAMRLGEICALESSDIKGNAITINKSMALCEDGSYRIKQPKTFSSYRTVQAPDFVIQRLSGINGRILDMKPYNVTKALKRALKKNNLPDFRFHDLRHYAASILHAIGIPDQYIMNYGGWKTDYVMKSVYRNTIDEETQKMNIKISEHFTELRDGEIGMQHEMQHEIKKAL